jgi:hypothetical protein
MKVVFTALLYLILHCTSFSQKTSFQILNQRNRKVIPFVNIYSTSGKVGLYSGSSGQFTLSANSTDTIVFSHVGFKTTKIPFEKLGLTILLHEDRELLNQVKVVGKKEIEGLNTAEAGFFKEKKKGLFTNINEAIIYFPNEHPYENAAVSKAKFKVARGRTADSFKGGQLKNRRITVRLKAYKWDQFSNKPGVAIPIRENIQTIRKKQLKIIFDLEEAPIPIPREGICIGIEYLGYQNKEGEYIAANINDKNFRQFAPRFVKTENTESVSFIKSEVGSGDWGNLQGLKANFQFSIEISY